MKPEKQITCSGPYFCWNEDRCEYSSAGFTALARNGNDC